MDDFRPPSSVVSRQSSVTMRVLSVRQDTSRHTPRIRRGWFINHLSSTASNTATINLKRRRLTLQLMRSRKATRIHWDISEFYFRSTFQNVESVGLVYNFHFEFGRYKNQ